jgi:flagellar motility protein MotE (MotC chaperone)
MIDPTMVVGVLAAASKSVGLIDKISHQVTHFLQPREKTQSEGKKKSAKKDEEIEAPEPGFKIEGDKQKKRIVVKSRGRTVQTVTATELQKKLSPEDYEHIKTLEASMDNNYQLWKALYPKRNGSPDELKNAQTERQLKEVVKSMKQDFDGIFSFLELMGIRLDDHYQRIRVLVENAK